MTRNHFNDGGDLLVEQRTLFRQMGWVGQTGHLYLTESAARAGEPGGYSPLYQQIAVDNGDGWDD